MLTAQQITYRPLECAWMPSGEGLYCVWVERQASVPAGWLSQPGEAAGPQRKVA